MRDYRVKATEENREIAGRMHRRSEIRGWTVKNGYIRIQTVNDWRDASVFDFGI